jgi:iron-sulfur cluster assembly protein
MAITLTDAAAQQIKTQIARHSGSLGLRVGVKNVGCSGFAYTYDMVFEHLGATLVVDLASLTSIDGSCLDYVSEGMKKSFQFDNPNVGSTCGCGESFNLKGGSAKKGSA